jgi:hypothetical protein
MLNFTVGLNQDEKMAELEAIKKTQPVEDLNGLF